MTTNNIDMLFFCSAVVY